MIIKERNERYTMTFYLCLKLESWPRHQRLKIDFHLC